MLLFAIIAGWLAGSVLKLAFPNRSPPKLISSLVFAFLAWAAIAALIGIANGAFYKHSLLELRPLLHFMLILPIASDFKRRDAERTLVIMMIISVAISTKGLYLYQQGIGDPALFSEGNIRVTSIEFLYLVTSALTAIELFLRRKGPAPVLLGIFFLNCAALAVTFQRAAWLALLISVIFLIIAHRELRKGFLLAGILTISGLAAITASNFSDGQKFIKSLQGRMSSISSYESDVSALHRLEEWKASLKMIRQHPVIGNGLGSKVYFYSPLYSKDNRRLGYQSDDFYIHNSFIWVAVKTGLVGTLLFITFLSIVCRDTLSLLLRSPPGEQRSTITLLASFLAAITISSIFGPMLTSDLVSPLVAFTVGSVYAIRKTEDGGNLN